MKPVTFRGKTYEMDDQGFLADWREWDEAFAEGISEMAGV